MLCGSSLPTPALMALILGSSRLQLLPSPAQARGE